MVSANSLARLFRFRRSLLFAHMARERLLRHTTSSYDLDVSNFARALSYAASFFFRAVFRVALCSPWLPCSRAGP